MKHALAAYGVVFVVLTMLYREYEAAGWTGVDAIGIASAVVDGLLVAAAVAAVLLAGRLGLDRWAHSMARWRRQQARAAAASRYSDEIIGVTSWRPAPQQSAAPAVQSPAAGFTYVGPSYGHETAPMLPFPERPDRRD
jgi:hypothetical protein